MDRLRSVLSGLGAILTGAGVLILLFVGYQLWGTGLYTSRQQGQLESEFRAKLEAKGGASTTSSTAGSSSGSPSTTATTPTTSTAPPTGEFVAQLKIPKIDLDQYVVQGVGLGDLRKGPGHYPQTPLPGEEGNSAIAGHRTTYGAPFNRLGELVDGDEIQVTTLKGTFTYRIAPRGVHVVKPSQVEVLDPTPIPTLTLTTCHPKYSAKERLIVVAHLAPGQTATAATPPPPTDPSGNLSGDGNGSTDPQGGDEPLPGDAFDDAGLASDRSKVTTTLWGLLTAAIGIGWWVAIRRRRDWVAYVGGVMPFLIALFFFYAHLELLLPANF